MRRCGGALVVAIALLAAAGPANAAIIDALRRAGVHVTVLGFAWPGEPPSDPEGTVVLGEVDVRTDTASAAQKLAWMAKAVA